MRSLIASILFGIAAVVVVSEQARSRGRRLVVKRARQQVGLLPVEDQRKTKRGLPIDPRLVGVGVLAMLAGAVALGPFGGALGMVPIMSWRSWRARKERKRRERLADQLAPALQLVVGHLRIGRNVTAAFSEVAAETEGPLGELFSEVLSEVRLGASLDESLQVVADREGDRHLGVVASAIGLQSRHGGSLVEILETVVETIEEEDRLRRDIRSLTADGRLSAQVLLAMPIAMLVLVTILSPGYTAPLIEHPTGRAMSASGIVLGLVGWRWLRALSTPKVVA